MLAFALNWVLPVIVGLCCLGIAFYYGFVLGRMME